MNTIPGFNGEASLSPTMNKYRSQPTLGSFSSEPAGGVAPQLFFGGDPDLGAYLRCKANGGSETICRFFGGFPFFTLGRFFPSR
jgi:hypothetical protein